jgi:hypothetical protein
MVREKIPAGFLTRKPVTLSDPVRVLRNYGVQSVLFAGLAGILAWQLFLPGFIGIANNGDFEKVAGWLCLAQRGTPTNFTYFHPDFVWGVRNFWDSPYRSSETALGWLAIHLANAAHEGAHFDIRWLAGIHVALCLLAFAVLLFALRKLPAWVQAVTAGVPLLIFTDACYAAMLNSFYMDAAAFCSLLLLTAIAVWMSAGEEPRIGQLVLFFFAACLFVTSKTQHAIWAFFPAGFLVAASIGSKTRLLRVLAWGMAAVVLIAGVTMEVTADRAYKGQALFNVLFARIGAQGPAAMPDLLKLGVKPEEARYLGMHSYMPDSPSFQWAEEFYERIGFRRLLGWYLSHPVKTFRMIRSGLLWEEELMRANNLGNYRIEEGHRPSERTRRFALWSDLRSRLFHRAPWYLPVWYALFFTGCAIVIARRHSRVWTRMAWLALGIGLLGAGEFLASSLADCLDVSRHLFLFHACTDLTFCFAAAWAVQGLRRRKKPGPQLTVSRP